MATSTDDADDDNAGDADEITCPFCGSTETHVEQETGPARCRTVHYCEACENPFEEFS